nr:unnamed protein product [Digitaria exilis]
MSPRLSARTGAASWGMSEETTAPCYSRRWGEDEEVDGRPGDAAPFTLHGHRPEPRGGGGKGEAAAGGEGKAESVASPGGFPNERLERESGRTGEV